MMVAAVAAMGLFGVVGTASATSVAIDPPCHDTALTGNQNNQFDRCISGSPTGTWLGLDCASNVNVDANGNSPFNVFSADNNCDVRVWLHQFKNWTNNGWSFCISPGESIFAINTPTRNPLNIYFSSNTAPCP
jgi:hypothetical protein